VPVGLFSGRGRRASRRWRGVEVVGKDEATGEVVGAVDEATGEVVGAVESEPSRDA
jgi:hypothetical protein